jgi:pimeloyl-ACP methyl ester carboxylesterase
MTNNSPQLSALTATTARRSYTLSYFDWPSSAPAILYVHGLGCSKADFMEMASLPELQTFRLVSADNPGCGDSPYDDNHPLNIDGVVALMESFVAHLGLNRFLLVAGSMGGLLALLYAERNPSKIAGFVNVEGNLAPEDCMFRRSVIPHSYSHFASDQEGPGRENRTGRFLSLAVTKCFLYGSQNRHLSYLQRLRESECAVVETPNANLPIGVFNIRQRRNLK